MKNSQSLRTKELADPETSRKIAAALAKMHTVEMPLAKDSSWIENTLEG